MDTKIWKITSSDGYVFKCKIRIPDSPIIKKTVIFVNGSGPNTYDNKRMGLDGKSTFCYYDLFAQEFCRRGMAYCTFNTRGVEEGETPPLFAEIDEEAYKQYLPHNTVEDVVAVIQHIRRQPFMEGTAVLLLGWSEGSIIAPLVALRKDVEVNKLLLAGYCNENLLDVLQWQLSGHTEYTYWSAAFDYAAKGYITKLDYEEDRYKARYALFGEAAFEEIDTNKDGVLDIQDAAARSLPHLQGMLAAIEHHDDEWLKHHHGVRLTTGWFQEHFSLRANKEVLPCLDIPIVIVHGEIDAMCPKSYAEDIRRRFETIGKTNLKVIICKGHDHDLNYALYVLRQEISFGLRTLFSEAEAN